MLILAGVIPRHQIRGGEMMTIRAIIPALLLLSFAAVPADPITELDLSPYGNFSEFVVRDGILYASLHGEGATSTGGCGILALDIGTGEELWFRGSTGDDTSFEDTPWNLQYHDGRLYSVIYSVGLLCLDAETGEQEFLWQTGATVIAPSIIEDGTLYVASKTRLAAMDAATGEILWTFSDSPGEMGMVPTLIDINLHNGKLFAGSIIPSVRCFDAATGEFLWRSEGVLDTGGAGYAHIHHVSDVLAFVTTASGELTMLDTGSGRMVATVSDCEYLAGDENGVYLYLFNEGDLCEMEPETGMTTWCGAPETFVDLYSSQLVLSEDMFCIGASDGQIWLGSRLQDDLLIDGGTVMDFSDAGVWVTALDEQFLAVSGDGHVLLIDAGTLDSRELDTGVPTWMPITVENGTGYFPSGSSLIIIHLEVLELPQQPSFHGN